MAKKETPIKQTYSGTLSRPKKGINKANNNHSKIFIALSSILTLIFIGISLFLYNRVQTLKREIVDINTKVQSLFINNASDDVYSEPESIFIKRNFLPSDKFMDTYDYPDELLNLTDENLIGFNCLKRYDYQPNGYYSVEDYFKFKKDELYDSNGAFNSIKTVEDKLKTSGNGTITSISPCTTDENKDLLAYSVTPNIVTTGGAIGSDIFYGYVSSGNVLNRSIVPMKKEAYFRCNEVLAITKGGYLYVSCGSGDGGYSTKSIYKINLLRDGNATLLYKCKSAFGQPTTCGKIQ
ncbi:MAG: hypothetical protein WA152_02465 [Microgenomates group bacterium]